MMKRINKKTLFFALIVFLVGIVLNPIMSELVFKLYPNRPIVPDLFFSLLPKIEWLQYLSDPLMIVASLVFIWMVMFLERDKIPKYLFAFGLIHIFRALMIILTPLGRIVGNNSSYGIFNMVQYGMFPSGHTASAALFMFLTSNKRRGLKAFFMIFLLFQMVVLLFSRGHYSIDIVGGLMNAYIAHRKADDYSKKLLLYV
jgi:membrane-associated phospholipid phosphatase